MDVATVEFLRTDAGRRLLDEVAAAYDGSPASALATSERLRHTHPPDRVAAALSQIALRRKAVTKFGADADHLLFTTDGLEQATHRRVATHRARRVLATGATSVLDLGCGIGADLLAFARTGTRVDGIELDPATAAIAQANLDTTGSRGRVQAADALEADLDQADLVFADPARRGPAGRVFDPDAYSPPWSFVEHLLAGEAVVKLAPGLPHARIPRGVEAEWISLDGQLREAVLWSGRAVGCDRRATVLREVDGGTTIAQLTDADAADADVRAVGRYVYEPDDAVVRAHLVTGYAAGIDGWLLDPHLAYVSTDTPSTSGAATGRGYAVTEVLPFREKQLRSALRARGIGILTIKKRGVEVTPEQLRARLQLRGPEAATLILTRTPGGAQALLVEPLPVATSGVPRRRPDEG